ncbi:MAG: hypothetical protein M3290_11725 [Actinomycetota bacterium]|nr:hypothetical protein [Actinomycetota bacterium]
MLRLTSSCVAIAICLVACGGAGSSISVTPPSGPPTIDPAAISEHAAQLDDKLPSRPPGSQQEFAAAAYILAHFQRAGYVARLDSVPFKNDVNSTNVVALPPSGGAPTVAVVAPYGTGASSPSTGPSVGLLLELARALNVAFPHHSVEFVALGAEYTSLHGGALGSRRLAKIFLGGHEEPLVLVLDASGSGGSLEANPNGAAIGFWRTLMHVAFGKSVPQPSGPTPSPDVFASAGLPRIVVAGGAAELGSVLLRFLESPGVQPSPTSS